MEPAQQRHLPGGHGHQPGKGDRTCTMTAAHESSCGLKLIDPPTKTWIDSLTWSKFVCHSPGELSRREGKEAQYPTDHAAEFHASSTTGRHARTCHPGSAGGWRVQQVLPMVATGYFSQNSGWPGWTKTPKIPGVSPIQKPLESGPPERIHPPLHALPWQKSRNLPG